MGAFLMWKDQSKTMFFDVVTTEQTEATVTATEHPVEKGANITDHVRKNVDRVTLEVFVSNTPIDDFNGRGGKFSDVSLDVADYEPPLAATPGAIFNAIGSAISSLFSDKKEYKATVLKWDRQFDAVAETLETLRELQEKAELFTVVTSARDYPGMILEKIDQSRTPDSGTGATLRLEFRQIRIVESKIVTAPVPTESRGKVKKAKGVQGPKAAKDPEKKKSLLSSLTGKGLSVP